MIRHICLFKLKEENREENKKNFLEATEILRDIKEIKNYLVVQNAVGAKEANEEIALIFDFDSLEDLKKYSISKEHEQFKKIIHPLRISRACIDYEI